VTELVGRELALAAHPLCRTADADQAGLTVSEIEALLSQAGVAVGGRDKRKVLQTALNNSQDLFELAPKYKWRWLEPRVAGGEGMSGRALAEEAYRLAISADPGRLGLHYEKIKMLLIEDGIEIRGTNPGKTVFQALNDAKQWFDWVSSGTFRWK